MEVEITSLNNNPLMNRREADLTIKHPGEPTPSQEDIVSRFSAENNLDEENIEVEGIYTGFGSDTSEASLKVYEEMMLEETDVEEEETGTSTDAEYQDIVSGTISHAKDQLQDMESPDFQAALEAEKAGKNRKTLVEWLEKRV